MASDITRIIDIVTVGGVGLLVVIHVQADIDGKLVWHLLGCPAVEGESDTSASGDCQQPVSGGVKRVPFRFHSAPHLVELAHACEAKFGIGKAARRARLALTLGDGVICEEGSCKFVEHESKVDGSRFDHLREGVCALHASDDVGNACDKHFAETMIHDRFLRLVQSGFAWGTGRLILRGGCT